MFQYETLVIKYNFNRTMSKSKYSNRFFCQLDNCAAFLHSDLAPQWSAEEKKLPLAFAILDHRFREYP